MPGDAAWRRPHLDDYWSPGEHLLASLIEVTDGVALRELKFHGAKRVGKPLEIRRPEPPTPPRRPHVGPVKARRSPKWRPSHGR